MSSPEANALVDSYRFLDGITRRVIKTWIGLPRPADTPWSPLGKPLAECTIALVGSGGIALKDDQPFDQEIERRDPWGSDPSYRVIPRDVQPDGVKVYHLHYNPAFAEQDVNCIFPVTRLVELEAQGEIGRAAPSHYSYMGYTLRPQQLLTESVPAIIRQMRDEGVDAAALVPV